jgi:hypothetical protein
MPAESPRDRETRPGGAAGHAGPNGRADQARAASPAAASGGTGPIGRAAPAGLAGLAGRRLRSRRPFVLAGAALLALLAGASAALAAAGTGSTSRALSAAVVPAPSVSAPAPGPQHAASGSRQAIGGLAWLGRLGAIAGLLHGQFVVARPAGGVEPAALQAGRVTAVSPGSLTVRSADGYRRTYLVASSTRVDGQRAGISVVRIGHAVRLVATVSGAAATAASIEDMTLLPRAARTYGYLGAGSPWPGVTRPGAARRMTASGRSGPAAGSGTAAS